jgi:HK97 gp10 family phage protein
MANKRETKMDGLAEILSALEKMGVDVKSEKLQNMIKKESQCIIDTAKSLAPADTGNMRNSIGFITKMDKDNRERVLIGLNGNYYNHYLGVMFEYGTVARIQESTGRYTGQLGTQRAFMRPAMDQNRNRVIEGIKKGVDQIIADLAKKNNLIYK